MQRRGRAVSFARKSLAPCPAVNGTRGAAVATDLTAGARRLTTRFGATPGPTRSCGRSTKRTTGEALYRSCTAVLRRAGDSPTAPKRTTSSDPGVNGGTTIEGRGCGVVRAGAGFTPNQQTSRNGCRTNR